MTTDLDFLLAVTVSWREPRPREWRRTVRTAAIVWDYVNTLARLRGEPGRRPDRP